MNKLDSVTEAFAQLEDGDELVIETEYGMTYNREVSQEFQPGETDALDERFVFGAYELCDYLVHSTRGVSIKEATRDGLEVNGEGVTTVLNVTQETWAGENEELVEKTVSA